MDRFVLWIAATFYLAGFVVGSLGILRERRHSHGLMLGIVLAAFVLQSIGLGLRGAAVGGCPLGNTFELCQFSAWSATVLYLLVGSIFRLSMLGYFSSSLAASLSLVSLLVPSWDASRNTALSQGNPFVAMHAGLAMFAYGVFALLALTSLLLIFRHYSLKSRRLGGWFSFLPPLFQLEQISARLLWVGTGLMTVAMGVGYMYWRLDDASVNRSKLLAVALVWFAYALAMALRSFGVLVGRRFAWVCLLLYLGVLLSYKPIDRSRHPSPSAELPASSETQGD